MQDRHLLHFGDLALSDSEPGISATHPHIDPLTVVAYTGLECLLADEDKVSLRQLPPAEVQNWCLSRITEHQHHIQRLRHSYGAAARSAIFTTKSHIRALRSAYSDAAAINLLLPPELLIEIFSHLHPAGVINRRRVPVLHVGQYWRSLLFRAPQFWSNLLSLPWWKLSRPTQLDRFRAALSRSGSTSLSLPVRYWDEVIAGILASQASRISSLTVGPMVHCIEKIAQLLEHDMPRLTHLVILESSLYHRGSTFVLDFSRHRNIRILELERTYILTPVAPYTSLCHLELRHCRIRPSPTSRPVRALHVVHSALEFFPNLETLSTVYSLSDDDSQGLSGPPLAKPRKAVHLPRLRLLEVCDFPAYIPAFLSHLVLPPTTALVLQPNIRRDLSPGPPTVPLFPGITGSDNHGPCASLSLHLKIDTYYLARWETHGAGPETVVRPVRVTLGLEEVPQYAEVVARFSRELGAALGGITALTATAEPVAREDWETVLAALPRLRSLMYGADIHYRREVLDLLAGTETGTPLCPELVHLGFMWDVPTKVDMRAEDEWRWLCDDDVEDNESSIGPRHNWSLAVSLREFRDVLAERLERRGRDGTCAQIQKLWVAPRQWRFDYSDVVMEEWQRALAERCLRERLPGYLVEEISFVKDLF
ncbi:hypothetical protein V8D89_002565 [Ganoderma adspersum]